MYIRVLSLSVAALLMAGAVKAATQGESQKPILNRASPDLNDATTIRGQAPIGTQNRMPASDFSDPAFRGIMIIGDPPQSGVRDPRLDPKFNTPDGIIGGPPKSVAKDAGLVRDPRLDPRFNVTEEKKTAPKAKRPLAPAK